MLQQNKRTNQEKEMEGDPKCWFQPKGSGESELPKGRSREQSGQPSRAKKTGHQDDSKALKGKGRGQQMGHKYGRTFRNIKRNWMEIDEKKKEHFEKF